MKKKKYLMIIMALVLVLSVGCKEEVEKDEVGKLEVEEEESEVGEDQVGKLEELEKDKEEESEIGKLEEETKEESKDKTKEDNIKEEKIENKGEINMGLEQLELPKEGEKIGVIKTNHGEIKFRLFEDIAPKTVENFMTLSNDKYYNGIVFHRVMNEFMIQGGDPTATGSGGASIWGKSFEDEFHPNYHNFRGSLSMANSGPNTNGSQFFIVQKTDVDKDMLKQLESFGEESGFSKEIIEAYKELGGTPWLDFKHTVFGQVFEGMDVVDKIAGVKVDGGSRPLEDVVMEDVKIVEYKK